jgi:hypothetical protein
MVYTLSFPGSPSSFQTVVSLMHTSTLSQQGEEDLITPILHLPLLSLSLSLVHSHPYPTSFDGLALTAAHPPFRLTPFFNTSTLHLPLFRPTLNAAGNQNSSSSPPGNAERGSASLHTEEDLLYKDHDTLESPLC